MTVELQELGAKITALAENAAAGEDVVLLREGKPLAKLTHLSSEVLASTEKGPVKRVGFLEGEWKVPEDYDTAFADEIQSMFRGERGK